MLLDYYPAPSLQQLWQRIKQQRWLRLWRQQLPVDYPLTVLLRRMRQQHDLDHPAPVLLIRLKTV